LKISELTLQLQMPALLEQPGIKNISCIKET